jgi:MFS transporter, DHA1 family, multidrug resistance protein
MSFSHDLEKNKESVEDQPTVGIPNGHNNDETQTTRTIIPSPSQSPPPVEAAKDPTLVEFEGPDDPLNPQNIPQWKKWIYANIVGWLSLVVTFATSVFSTATAATAEEFGVSSDVMTLGTALFIAGVQKCRG